MDNNDNIYNEEDIFLFIQRVKEEGTITDFFEHLSRISEKQFSSLFFRIKLEPLLQINLNFIQNDSTRDNTLILSNLVRNKIIVSVIRNNYPSTSLIILEYLKDKGINIKQLICSPKLYISFIRSSLDLDNNINEKIMLKNKIEEKAQLELVKMIIELSLEYIKGNEKTIMQWALESLNIKIIKYFVSLNIKNYKKYFIEKNGLHIALRNKILSNYDKEQQKSLLKIIKYLVDQGVDIHQRNKHGELLIHLAAKFRRVKIIKYLVSLGIDIHSVDKQNNSVLLSAFYERNEFMNNNLDYNIKQLEIVKNLFKITKYFISIGINIEHQNKDGRDVLLYSMDYANFDLLKLICSSMPLKSQLFSTKLTYFQNYVRNAISHILTSFNIELIKYLDEFPCFANYFDGENKIKTKNSILFDLILIYSINLSDGKEVKFGKFKELFEFFLNKRNNINSIDYRNRIPIQQIFSNNISICWKYWDYLIEKGSNLHNISNHGSILHYLLTEEMKIEDQEYGKYIMIRSMEINSQIVNHPKFDDLKDEDSFEDFFRKDEEEENEEKVIKWKRGMAEILMKSPKILNLLSPYNTSLIFKFDEKYSQLVKA